LELKAVENTAGNSFGLDIWQNKLLVCHLLVGNFRAKADPTWAADLEKFRNGPDKALLDKLNSTLHMNTNSVAPNSVLLCYRNKVRQALNRNYFLSRCSSAYNKDSVTSLSSWRQHGGGMLEVKGYTSMRVGRKAPKAPTGVPAPPVAPASGNIFTPLVQAFKKSVFGSLPPVVVPASEDAAFVINAKQASHTKALFKYLHDSPQLEEQLVHGLTPRLGLVLGEQYVIPFKLSSPSGGAPKGMEVELVDIVLKPGKSPTWDARRRHYTVVASKVYCVLVKATLGDVSKKVLAPGMPPGVLAIVPTMKACTLQFQGIKDTFYLTQVPLTPGFARTLHKVQGQKKTRVILFPESGTTAAFAYCGLSRCPTMAGMRLLSFLNDDPYFYKRGPSEVVDSIRLELLNIATRRESLASMGPFEGDDVENASEEVEERLRLALRHATLQCACLVNAVGNISKKKQKSGSGTAPALGSTLAPGLPGARKDAQEPSTKRSRKKKVHLEGHDRVTTMSLRRATRLRD
jgi:hypothetical protein